MRGPLFRDIAKGTQKDSSHCCGSRHLNIVQLGLRLPPSRYIPSTRCFRSAWRAFISSSNSCDLGLVETGLRIERHTPMALALSHGHISHPISPEANGKEARIRGRVPALARKCRRPTNGYVSPNLGASRPSHEVFSFGFSGVSIQPATS